MKKSNFISHILSPFKKQTAEQEVLSGTCGENASWNMNPETGELRISGDGAINDFYGSKHQPWGKLLKRIKSIVIEDGITVIGFQSFRYCKNLTQVSIPESVTEIREYAFAYCGRLPKIILPSGLREINNSTFICCRSLTCIELPEGITFIGKSAFEGCDKLESVTIPSTVKNLEGQAFFKCESLSKLHLPDTLTHIEQHCFANCVALAHVKLPASLTHLGANAFAYCVSLEDIGLPDGLISVGNEAFADCRSLTRIDIPVSVREIGERIFAGCNGLTTLSLPFPGSGTRASYRNFGLLFGNTPHTEMIAISQERQTEDDKICYLPIDLNTLYVCEGCEIIPRNCLCNCKTLKKIELPASLFLLEEKALYGCAGLQDIICKSKVPAASHENTFSGIRKTSCRITVPKTTEQAYRHEDGWKEFYHIMEEA